MALLRAVYCRCDAEGTGRAPGLIDAVDRRLHHPLPALEVAIDEDAILNSQICRAGDARDVNIWKLRAWERDLKVVEGRSRHR
jgi:hypothetical protein